MTVRAVALKEEGTHPPSEGILARFAEVRPIRSLRDLEKVKEERPDIVLMDLRMPRVDGKEAVEVLRQSRSGPVVILFDSKMQPTTLLKRLNSLGTLKAARYRRSPNLSQIVRLLGVSQEVLSRILNVSARTVHRWLKGHALGGLGSWAGFLRLPRCSSKRSPMLALFEITCIVPTRPSKGRSQSTC